MFWKGRIPSERKILRTIFEMYRQAYPRTPEENNEALLSIDLPAVAAALKVSPEFLFQYLVMMDLKYRYQSAENTYRHLYVRKFGSRDHGVSLPYVAAILARHNEDASRHRWPFWISVAALLVSLGGVAVQYVGNSCGVSFN